MQLAAQHIVAAVCIASCAGVASASSCFDNNELTALQQKTSALLYVWSPRMVLSAQHAGVVQAQAQRYGLQFIALHDARVPQAEVQAALQRLQASSVTALQTSVQSLKSSAALCADSLTERDALRHFPTAFVLQPSGLHRWPVVGAMPPSAWAQSLQQRLTPVALKAAPGSELAPVAQ